MKTKQSPLPSGYGARTQASEVLGTRRLDGLTALVTGGYTGVGLGTTRALAAAGATVIVPARTPEKARAALVGLERVELESLELGDPASIDAFATRFLASGRPLHLLINNAGIMATPLSRDARGFESQLAINHIGHFQLTLQLWPALRAARGARVISLTSVGHMLSAVDFEDPHFQHRPYDKWKAYGQSKTANALFALALDTRGEPHHIHAFSVHPGSVVSELARSVPEEELRALRASFSVTTRKNIEEGAATSVWCATSPQLEGRGGVYCEDVDISPPVPAGFTGLSGVRPWAMDAQLAERLWKQSEAWTGVTFTP